MPRTVQNHRRLLLLTLLGFCTGPLFFKIAEQAPQTQDKQIVKVVSSVAAPVSVTSTMPVNATSTTPDTTPVITTSTTPEGKGGVFLCGYDCSNFAEAVFPDYMSRWLGRFDEGPISPHPKREPGAEDILIFGLFGPCHKKEPRDFPGKVLFVNGEPRKRNMHRKVHLSGREAIGQDVYQVGLLPDTDYSVMIYYGAIALLSTGIEENVRNTLYDPTRKPKNTGLFKGLVYINKRCHKHREDAVNQISSIMPVWYGGRCKGNDNVNITRMPNPPTNPNWAYNRDAYSEYTFCFAMENSKTHNYMSEKIIMAFLAGCVPIYYGSEQIFDVFNKEAFVFYDPQHPGPALQKLKVLAGNETAYQQVLNQHILANGEQTVRDYFSLSDEIGGGFLKHKLRKTMGLPVV